MQSVTSFNFISHILSTDTLCKEYAGIPNRDVLKMLFRWIESVSQSKTGIVQTDKKQEGFHVGERGTTFLLSSVIC